MLIERSSEARQFGKFRQLLQVSPQCSFALMVEFFVERLAMGSLKALIVDGDSRVRARPNEQHPLRRRRSLAKPYASLV
jgi:hypothetical protein